MKPVLVKPNLDKELRVKADTSDYVTERVWSMKYENKKWRSIGFISKFLNKAKKNYEIHNKKILAVI